MKQTVQSFKWWIAVSVLALIFCELLYPGMNPYYQSMVMVSSLNIILAVSLTLVNGFTGQFSIGHAGFMAIGGYVAAVITFYGGPAWPGLPENLLLLLALFGGGVAAAISGYLVGLPSLRLKGDYLAIVTLGFGEIIRVVILNIEAIGGARGFTGLKALATVQWMIFVAIATTFTVLRLVGSSQGRAMFAVREDEVAAEAMGVNTTAVKVKAFVLGSFWAGVAGGLYAHYYAYLNPNAFNFVKSFEVVVIIVLGGLGSVSGAILAAIFLTVLPEALRPLQEYTQMDFRMIIYSLILIIFMIVKPQGLLGKHEIWSILRRRFKVRTT